jgi:ubiquinone/menaquinone biosynthesis C-methylase UbiE
MLGIPDRFIWATDLLDIKPSYNVLEIGCGVGILAESIGNKLKTGHFLGVDKSKPMIDKAKKRNSKLIAKGLSSFLVSDFKNTNLPDDYFEIAVAFNVNFFKKNSTKELLQIRKTLKNDGRLFVLYQDPYERDLGAATPIKTKLIQGNFEIIDITIKKFTPTSAYCIESRTIL